MQPLQLDLRPGAVLPQGIGPLFHELAMQARGPFNRLICTLTPKGDTALDWLASAPGGRNPFVSNFFLRCCGLQLTRELLHRGYPLECVVTDSPAQARLLRALPGTAQPALDVRVEPPLGPAKFWRRPVVTVLLDLLLCLWIWAWARLTRPLTRPLARPLPDAPLTLIDTFLGQADPSYDHYYPGLLEQLTSRERRNVVFVATVAGVGFGAMPGVLFRLRKAERNIMVREDYLHVADIFSAWLRALKTGRLQLGPGLFDGVDVAPLAREELRRLTAFDALMGAFLSERFAARLAQAGVRVGTVINWFENQAVDKGFNAGFARQYPIARHLGYLGFLTSPFFLCLSPIAAEHAAKVLPKTLCGIGPGSAGTLLEFLPDMPFEPAPAFRYRKSLNPMSPAGASAPFTVLLSLPMPMPHCLAVLHATAAILDRLPPQVVVEVKRHPLISEDTLRQAFNGQWPERFVFVDGAFDEVLKHCHVIVSMTSGTVLEALALAVPTIIVTNPYGLTWDPVPAAFDSELHCLAATPDDLLLALLHHLHPDSEAAARRQADGLRFRERYFTPVTRETVARFLGLETPDAPGRE